MTEPALLRDPSPGAEYTIYVFEKPEQTEKIAARWQRHGTFDSLAHACGQAHALFHSGQYHKVEIKQKFFHKRRQRHIDVTLKVLTVDKKKPPAAARVLMWWRTRQSR